MRPHVKGMNIDEQNLDQELQALRALARRLDALVRIPGTRLTLGFENILGLVPVVGDVLALAPSLWIVWKARALGATPGGLAAMVLNILIDMVIGMVPFLGDLFDIAFNANIRNVAILERNIAARAARAKPVAPAALDQMA